MTKAGAVLFRETDLVEASTGIEPVYTDLQSGMKYIKNQILSRFLYQDMS